ncbi:hypothetical protein Aperf_G00000112642 [Anoplocephala perfoliata]
MTIVSVNKVYFRGEAVAQTSGSLNDGRWNRTPNFSGASSSILQRLVSLFRFIPNLHHPTLRTIALQTAYEYCYNSWTESKFPVAISIKPGFRKRSTTIGRKNSEIYWDFDLLDKLSDKKVEGVPDYPFSKNRGSTEYTAVRNSYNGIAKLRVIIDNEKMRTETCTVGDFQVRSESPNRAQVFLTSKEETSIVFIAFNGIVWMQDKVWSRRKFCLDGLTPGSTYQLCVALEDCQNSWKCKSFTTFEKNYAKTSLWELPVHVESSDSDWIQLSWPPPKIKRPATPPIGYIILVRTVENCLEKALYFQAPWLAEDEKIYIRRNAEKLTSTQGCNGKPTALIEGDLDGYWPDFPGSRRSTWVRGWNTAEVDEQGPVGLFAITIDHLRPATDYQIEISPVIFPDVVGAMNIAKIVKVRTAVRNSGVKIEPKTRSVRVYNPYYPGYTVSEIGANPRHCEGVKPINKNEAAERLCNKSSVSSRYETVVPLTPGALYRVAVNSIQKVFQIPAPKISFEPQIEARAISSNLISLRIMRINTTTPPPLAFVTRICRSSSAENCRNRPIYREVVGTYSLYENGSVWQQSSTDSFDLNAYISTTENSKLYVLLYAYYGDREEVIHTSNLETRKSICKNWCIWPAGDWTSTKGMAFGVYETMFARITETGNRCKDFCHPLREAIDGESGCADGNGQMSLCNIPVCSNDAHIGCVTDVEFDYGITWIFAEWQSPRESSSSSTHYLILVTSTAEVDQCQAFIEKGDTRNLPPFIQTAVKSCSNSKIGELLNQSSLNITNLVQNTTYNVIIIPYLLDGRIGAVLEKVATTKLAPPCQVQNVEIDTHSSLVALTWITKTKPDCGRPTSLTVFINDVMSTAKIYNESQVASFKHNFEFCRKYKWRFDFENSAGRTSYSYPWTTHIGYPEIKETLPTIYYVSGSPSLGASYTSKHIFCKYEYVLQWGIWPYINNCEVQSGYPNSIALPPLQEGLVYNFAAQVQPRSASSKCGEDMFASNWSSILVYPTEMSRSEVKTHNKTVTAYIPTTEDEYGEQFGCLLPKTEYNGQHELRFIQNSHHSKAENTSVCIIVDWVVESSSAKYILGYLLEFTQSGTDNCRLFWIPCEDCLPGINPANALPEVTNTIAQIESSCLGNLSSLLQGAEQLNAGLNKETTRLLMAFQTSGSQNDQIQGVVRVHAVKMGSIYQIMEQIWQTNAQVILSKAGMHIGIVATVIVLLAIAILAALFIMKRKRRVVRLDQYMKERSEDEMSAEIVSAKKIHNKLVARLKKIPQPIPVSKFIETVAKYAQNDYASLRDEYKTCLSYAALQEDEQELTMEVGVHPKNRVRNRYKNICPYDQNRFKLKKEYALEDLCPSEITIPNAEPIALKALSDYVNASAIPSLLPQHHINIMNGDKNASKSPSVYIAAQAPKEHTVGLFWQAIWDSEVRLIVMLTRIKEREREKCFPYWPRKQAQNSEDTKETVKSELCSEQYGNISVTLQSSESGICYIRRVLAIRDTTAGSCVPRRIIQLQMTGWDDFMVPRKDDFYIFLKRYWDDLAAASSHGSIPVMVHCSAGVGRTGTFLAIDMLARYIFGLISSGEGSGLANGKEEGESIYANLTTSGKSIPLQNRKSMKNCTSNIDIFQTVLWLRSQRMKSVEQDIQYIFIFDFLSYYIQHLIGEAAKELIIVM